MSTTVEARTAGAVGARVRAVPWAAVTLVVAMAATAVVLLAEGAGLTFHYDEWNFVMNRRGWTPDTFLEPHNEHLSLLPVAVFKLLFLTVGLDDYWVYRLVLVALHLLCVTLVYVLARRRVDAPVALLAALSVVFLGAAWHNLLWPFQIGFLLSVAGGLGMLLALDARRYVVAGALLAVAFASSGVAHPFAAAAVVELALRRERPRAFVPIAVPILLYALWSLFYGNTEHVVLTSDQETLAGVVLHNVRIVPFYLGEAAAGAVGALLGLETFWTRGLVVVGTFALALYLWRRRTASHRLVALIAAALVYWGLAALLRGHLLEPAASRYVYVGAILVVLAVVELLRGVPVPPRALAAAVAVLALTTVGKYLALDDGATWLHEWSAYVRAELGALELAGPAVAPTFRPDATRAPDVSAGKYFAAVADYGSPADDPAQISERSEPVRRAADATLRRALSAFPRPARRGELGGPPPAVETRGAAARRDGPCAVVRPSLRTPVDLSPRGLGLTLAYTGPATARLRLRAFAVGYPRHAFARLRAGTTYELLLPRRPGVPVWHVRVSGAGLVRLCGVRAAP